MSSQEARHLLSPKIRTLHNLDHVEKLASHVNKKLVFHQGKAMQLQGFLDNVLDLANASEKEALDFYNLYKMMMVKNPIMPEWPNEMKDGEASPTMPATIEESFEIGKGSDRLF